MTWRLVAVLVALTALVLLVQDVPLAAYLRSIERNRIVTELQRDAFVIAGRSQLSLSNGTALNNPALTDMVTAYSAAEESEVVVVNSSAILVATSDPIHSTGESFATRPEITEALSGQTASGERESVTLNMRILYVAVPVLSGPKTVGAVRLTYPASRLDEQVNNRVKGIGAVALLTLLAAIVVAILLAGTITRPLKRIQLTTSRLAAGDLTARAATDEGAPELRELAGNLNTMANRLDRLIEAQRSFAGDASHQLRTPLTALRLRLDQAADALETDPQDATEPLDAARAETERLQHVIDGLLRLARAEGANQELFRLDLAEIAADRIRMWEPLAEEQGVSLVLTSPPVAWIMAIDGGAEQILDNYLDNAISFSPPGSSLDVTITADLEKHPRTIALSVCDSGPGLSPEQRARAFDRFWSERDDNMGSGLGLAIVAQLAEASNATVELRESPTHGVEAVAIFTAAN